MNLRHAGKMLNDCECITERNVKQNIIWGQLSTILSFDYSRKIDTANAAALKDMHATPC